MCWGGRSYLDRIRRGVRRGARVVDVGELGAGKRFCHLELLLDFVSGEAKEVVRDESRRYGLSGVNSARNDDDKRRGFKLEVAN